MSDEISLFALMDSHLSKTRLNDALIENRVNFPAHSASSILLPSPPGPRLDIPIFFPGNSPMKDFVAAQINNTLKAKEKRKKEEEEQQKIEEEMKRLAIQHKKQLSTIDGMAKVKLHEDQEYLIDLTPAIIQQPKSFQNKRPTPQQDSSKKVMRPKLGPTCSERPLRWDKETCRFKQLYYNLPCTTDVSFILKQKIRRGKCSSFGKVLCSRLWPNHYITFPYGNTKFESNIVPFDFKNKSPGDIYREKQLEIELNERKPKMSTRWTMNILDWI